MKNKRKMAINMIAQFVAFGINLGINFILAPFITNRVGKEVYGFVGLAFQMTSYITIVTNSLNTMLGRYITVSIGKNDYKSARAYFSSAVISNILVSIACIGPVTLLVLFIDKWLNVPANNIIDIQLLWAFIFFDFFASLITNGCGVATYATNNLDLSAKRNMVSHFIRAIILFTMFTFLPSNIWYVGFSKAVVGLFLIVSNIIFTKKLTPQLYFDKKLASLGKTLEMLKVGVWNSIQQLAIVLINGCDTLITNLYISAASMTLMSFAKTVPNYINTIISIVSGTFGPEMTILYAEGNIDAFVKYVKNACKITGFICSIPLIGFMVFGYDFFKLWLYSLNSQEVMTIQILSVMIILETVFGVYINPLYGITSITTRLRLPVIVTLIIGILNVIGSIFLCVHTGLGVYAIQIVSTILLVGRAVIFMPLYTAHIMNMKWNTFYGPLIRGSFSSIIIALVFVYIERMVNISNWITLFVVALICGILGYVINYFIVLNSDEKVMVKNLVWKKLKLGKKGNSN